MSGSMVQVSIIVPVYNSEKYLPKCIDSILNQDFENFELLLIDDGSTDESPSICDSYAQKDHRVRAFHKQNGGICEARNYGIERAEGEYIAFSDHDDVVLPGFLSENYKLAKDKNADVIKFGRRALYIRGEQVERTNNRLFPMAVLTRTQIKEKFLYYRFENAMTCVWDGFFKRSLVTSNQIWFDTKYKTGGEDIDFCSRCMARAETVVFNGGIFYEHYIRSGYSTSTKPDSHKLSKLENMITNLDTCMQELGISTQHNTELYMMNVVKEEIYPLLIYFRDTKQGKEKAFFYAESKRNLYQNYKVSASKLLKTDRKWGVFTLMFMKRLYGLMYLTVAFHRG